MRRQNRWSSVILSRFRSQKRCKMRVYCIGTSKNSSEDGTPLPLPPPFPLPLPRTTWPVQSIKEVYFTRPSHTGLLPLIDVDGTVVNFRLTECLERRALYRLRRSSSSSSFRPFSSFSNVVFVFPVYSAMRCSFYHIFDRLGVVSAFLLTLKCWRPWNHWKCTRAAS